MGLVTEEVRAKAEMYTGDEICREKTKCFLKEISMPNGLLPLKDIEEVGFALGFLILLRRMPPCLEIKLYVKYTRIEKIPLTSYNFGKFISFGIKLRPTLL